MTQNFEITSNCKHASHNTRSLVGLTIGSAT